MNPRLLLVPPLAIILAACSDQGPRPDDLRDEVARNRARWEATGLTTYTYDVERRCFCGFEGAGPVRVRVEAGAVVARTYIATGEAVPTTFEETFPSVDGLFDVLEQALEREADSVEVTWAESGLPLDFYIDYEANVADEEEGYTIVGLPAATP